MTQPATVGIVAGSGIDLSGVIDGIQETRPFRDFPAIPRPMVAGHRGEFVIGHCGGVKVVLQRGRLHFYEGHDYDAVTGTVDAMYALGATVMLFTNAAGGLRAAVTPGALMAVEDIRLWRCLRWKDHPSAITPSLQVDSVDYRGVLAWMHGPTYETRAEIAALQTQGAAAVGMSTAPELHRCAELGIPAGAITCITNDCTRPHKLSHEDVLAVAAASSRRLTQCVRTWIAERAHTGAESTWLVGG